ncbi:MiaB/RimO family radical SAM methylthiotransferase [Desulfovibrio sp. SGI.169]|uniref:MiaB/RimO family radical SAM methylthiotransferase n=1 Tax=Desulfovibrio sp. SGI.169 TaxID=3420561 RepID=UPI003D07A02F
MPVWKFFIATFGCKVNQYESQALREAWQKLGGVECDAPGEADVLCVNSCAITAKGERDARNAVFRLRREAPAARLILTGCAARLFADFRPRPGAIWAEPDLLVPQEEKSRLLRGPWPEKNDSAFPADAAFPPFQIRSFRRARPVLKVQDGCAHRCTYCIVPLTRGKPRSRAPQEILEEARRLLRAGHAELMLSGVNLRQYGRDIPGHGDFWSLLHFLDKNLAPEFAGRARLRISSLEPSQLVGRGLATLKGCRLLCPHLHISLQHASPAVLRRMGRGHYTAAMLEEAVASLAAHWPRMGLGADILVGFPGETDEDLRLLLELIERLPLSYAHVFPYSRRPGTAADGFGGHLPQAVKLRRAALTREAVARRQQRFFREQLDLPDMLVVADVLKHMPPGTENENAKTGHGSGLWRKGVNEFYAPCLFRAPATDAACQDDALTGLLPARPVRVTKEGLLVELKTGGA